MGGSQGTVLANRCSACTAGAEPGFDPWEQGNTTGNRHGSEMGWFQAPNEGVSNLHRLQQHQITIC